MTRYGWNVVGLTLVLGGALGLLLGDRLVVWATPHVCYAPCTVRVMVQVEPQEDNRQLTVEVEGERYESASAVTLDGASAPKTLPYFWFKDLPPGLYRVEAILQSYDRIVDRRSTQVQVN